MGIASWAADIIIREHAFLPISGTVLVIGRQTIQLTPGEAIDRIRSAGVAPATERVEDLLTDDATEQGKGVGYIRDDEFFRLLGVEEFFCLDHSDYEGATLIHDLNKPLPSKYERIADFIVDGSTLDNIFDPAAGIVNINKLLKPDGRLLSINTGTNTNVPYLVFTPMWFFDYFCYNGFRDAKVYHISLFPGDKINVVTPSLEFLNRSVQGVHNPQGLSGYESAIVVLAEKAANSTWDISPSQHHYRSAKSWDIFEQNLQLIKSSDRPHLIWSNAEWRSHVPDGYEPLLG